ncbi:serine hydrolase [bacterium]|nr:serine hydrolase [bacterium]
MNIPEIVAPEKAGFSSKRMERIDALQRRYVDDGHIAGTSSLVYRKGHIVHASAHGHRDREAGAPMTLDTILRIYSMTKPITTVAALMLMEEGAFLLNDPIAKYLPAFEDAQVYAGADVNGPLLVKPERPPTIQDLMRHTAGLSYGWFQDSPVEEMYRLSADERLGCSLEQAIDSLARLPLLFHPGTAWRYGVATDVLGRLVEVISGLPLDEFFRRHIFAPLRMNETGFHVPEDQHHRFASMYSIFEELKFGADLSGLPAHPPLHLLQAANDNPYLQPPVLLSGGGGLVSTLADYLRFAQMLLNGGVLDGVRILGRKTVELMSINHLPSSLVPIGIGVNRSHGFGFGLGVSVLVDLAASALPGSLGNYGWSGAAGTRFWIDPQEELIGLFAMQMMPSDFYPIQTEYRVAVYQALER